MTCSIFIASTTATCWPGRTSSPTATLIATIVPWIGDATPGRPVGPDHVRDFVLGRPRRLPARPSPGRVVREQRQRIAALHPRPGEPGLARRVRGGSTIALPMTRRRRASVADVFIDPARVNLAGNEIRDAPGCCAGTGCWCRRPRAGIRSAREQARVTAAAKSGRGECAITLASSESNAPDVR